MKTITLLIASLSLLTACRGSGDAAERQGAPSAPTAPAGLTPGQAQPRFDADTAYRYVADQLAFGPRVPGSQAQKAAAAWLAQTLRRHGAAVSVAETEATAYNGDRLPVVNIVGSYRPEAKERILLMAHWDSRHVADQDPSPQRRHDPVPAANDGASGVGVLLELARQAGLRAPRVGIDIFLTDAEDYGPHEGWTGQHRESQWGLGTQAWCRAPHVSGYTARFGVLLDMVGAPDATFYREYFSMRYAAPYVDLIWATAARLGYADLFVDERGGGVTDDHTFVNTMLGIPTVDIIDTRPDRDGTFFPYWHTTDDTLDKVSAETLGKVGHVLMQLIY